MSGVKGRSGRKLGSKNKKTIERENMLRQQGSRREEYIEGEPGLGIIQPFIPIKKKVTFKMQYVATDGSTFWYYKESGKCVPVKCGEIFEVSEKEREKILKAQVYYDGYLIDVNMSDVNEDLPNTLNDVQLKKLFSQGVKKVRNHILKMDSKFAIRRVKNYAAEHDYPASVVKICDARIQELEEEEENSLMAPVMDKSGRIVKV